MITERQLQVDRILAVLSQFPGLCAMAPLNWHPPIVRVAARIYDLREMGYEIVAQRVCPDHRIPAAHAYYRLGGGRLF